MASLPEVCAEVIWNCGPCLKEFALSAAEEASITSGGM